MIFNYELLLFVLEIAIIIEAIALATTQKVKSFKSISKGWQVLLFSFLINMMLGITFCYTYTDLSIILSLWVGFFSWVSASLVYEGLNKLKLAKGLSDYEGVEE